MAKKKKKKEKKKLDNYSLRGNCTNFSKFSVNILISITHPWAWMQKRPRDSAGNDHEVQLARRSWVCSVLFSMWRNEGAGRWSKLLKLTKPVCEVRPERSPLPPPCPHPPTPRQPLIYSLALQMVFPEFHGNGIMQYVFTVSGSFYSA